MEFNENNYEEFHQENDKMHLTKAAIQHQILQKYFDKYKKYRPKIDYAKNIKSKYVENL